MKKISMICIAALAMTSAATPAFAQHISPANTAFTATGGASLGTYQCLLTLPGQTGPNLGGAHNGHAAGGSVAGGTNVPNPSPQCVAITVDYADFTVNSFTPGGGSAGLGSATGSLTNVTVTPGCATAGPVPFTAENTGSGVRIILPSGSSIGGCPVTANLLAPGLTLVP